MRHTKKRKKKRNLMWMEKWKEYWTRVEKEYLKNYIFLKINLTLYNIPLLNLFLRKSKLKIIFSILLQNMNGLTLKVEQFEISSLNRIARYPFKVTNQGPKLAWSTLHYWIFFFCCVKYSIPKIEACFLSIFL